MSGYRPNSGPETAPASEENARYILLPLQDAGALIYDWENPRAWIQSTEVHSRAEKR